MSRWMVLGMALATLAPPGCLDAHDGDGDESSASSGEEATDDEADAEAGDEADAEEDDEEADVTPWPVTEAECRAAGLEWIEDESSYYPPSPDGPNGPTFYHCVRRCQTDADCPGRAPFCAILGLFSGGDWGCNDQMTVCREIDQDDCAPRRW